LKGQDKVRLDQLLQEKRPELSRSRIQAMIMAGNVLINDERSDKPGMLVNRNTEIRINEPENPFVSRGGLKLEGALEDFNLDVKGLTVIDVGASTGGFPDCLLKKGAAKVFAIDVGYGQLDYKLRNNSRVMLMERFNIRMLKPEDLPKIPDMAVVDVSFISLKLVFPVLSSCEIELVLALVKPQFEAGRIEASRGKGVIRDKLQHEKVLQKIISAADENGYRCQALSFSQLTGPKGNIEYFILLKRSVIKGCSIPDMCDISIKKVVEQAHHKLLKNKQ
jgi:23S rRNA (cytidine1920-2'-O)/16S rRNA (cytidine1409-2'-O)-methyltransferase